MKGDKTRLRTLLLAVLLAVVAAGSLTLRSENEEQELLNTFDHRAALLVQDGRLSEAHELLKRAVEADPAQAWLRILRFRTTLMLANQPSTGLQEAALVALKAIPPPPPASSNESQPKPVAPISQGTADVLQLQTSGGDRSYVSLFGEYSALLGRPRVENIAEQELSEVREDQWLVVPPSHQRESTHPGRTIYLGPHKATERVLGLVAATGLNGADPPSYADGDCDFVSETGLLHATPSLPLVAPFPIAFQPFAVPERTKTLATIRCGAHKHPALVESQDGRVLMFTFDFPKWIVRLRQGDIALVNRETDDVPGVRPSDMFVLRRSSEQLQVPHTDLVMEGLWRILERDKLTPRFWHHRPGASTTLVVTSDQDFASQIQMDIMISALRLQGVQPTILLLPKKGTFGEEISPPDPAFVAEARAFGVEFAMHPDVVTTPEELRGAVIAKDRRAFVEAFGFEPTTVRNHWVAWWGWVAAAKRLQEAGYEYDLSYLTLVSDYHEGLGYMTGSGLPLRFYDKHGAPVDIRQLATQLDDHPNPVVPQPILGDVQLDRKELYMSTGTLLDRSANEFHSPLVVNNHPLQFSRDPDWLLTMLKVAVTSDVAVMNVEGYADFVDALLASSVRQLEGNRFALLVQHREQEILLPESVSSVSVDGVPADLEVVERYGRLARSLRLGRGRHILELAP